MRQLEWGWERVRRPRPKQPKRLTEGVAELRRFVAEMDSERIGPVRRNGRRVYVALQASDGERYQLRITPRDYPLKAPRCTFVDELDEESPAAWPAYDTSGPFRPPNFICTPPTAEFYEYHDERAYDPREGSLVNTVSTIYAALNGPGYSGRYAGKGRGRRRRRADAD